MKIIIDNQSGFCFGVVRAIEMAEQILSDEKTPLYCLGEIVHNNEEVSRLTQKGMKTVSHSDIGKLSQQQMLIRAHGEPPETYDIAKQNNVEIHDATCPVVLKLQQRVKAGYEEMLKVSGQVLVFGKKGHAEVNGLVGQTKNKAIVIDSKNDIDKIDFSKPSRLYAQTTKSVEDFKLLEIEIIKRYTEIKGIDNFDFLAYDTICRQVANRKPQLQIFAGEHDMILFVSGKDSSNGKYLFDVCKQVNPSTFFVSNENEIDKEWFSNEVKSVGICGATSTPMWLMKRVADFIQNF